MIFLLTAGSILLFVQFSLDLGSFSGSGFAVLLFFLIISFLHQQLKKRPVLYLLVILQILTLFLLSIDYSRVLLLLPFILFPVILRERFIIKAFSVLLLCIPFFLVMPGEYVLYCAALLAGLLPSIFEERLKNIIQKRKRQIEKLEKDINSLEYRFVQERDSSTARENIAVFLERDRIAQKLHDELGHMLTGSIMQLEAAGILLEGDPVKSGRIIQQTADNLKQGMKNIRMSLRSLKPENSDIGLNQVKRELQDAMKNPAVTCLLTADEKKCRAIPGPVWDLISANLKEALTNFLKYSTGKVFHCTITVLNKVIKIEYKNEGLYSTHPKYGLGLSGMEQRTRKMGGTFIVDTSRGFSVIMLFAADAAERITP